MNRRIFMGSGLAAIMATQLPAQAWVNDVNSFLNSVKTVYAPFKQTNANGSSTQGIFYMQKPGKMRFEYKDPKYPLTVADGAVIAIFDGKSNLGPQKYPQFSTPVSLLSKNNIDLTNTKFTKELRRKDNGEVQVTMIDPAHPNYGQLIVRIDMKKRVIKGWQAIDQAGGRTTIELDSFNTGVAMNPNLFNIVKIQKGG